MKPKNPELLAPQDVNNATGLALTERGANHLQILHLNRLQLIAYRLEQKAFVLARQLNQTLRRQLQEAQQTTRQLETDLERDTNDR